VAATGAPRREDGEGIALTPPVTGCPDRMTR
jgi:hypothetical protein